MRTMHLIVAGVFALGLYACGRHESGPPTTPSPVQTLTAPDATLKFDLSGIDEASPGPSSGDGARSRSAEWSALVVPKEGGTAAHIAYPATRTLPYPQAGVSVGQGWNSFTDAKTSSQCVTFTPKSAGGQVATVESKRVMETDSLRKELGVTYSMSAKGSYGLFSGEGDAKLDYLSKSEVTNFGLNLLVKADVRNGVEYAAAEGTPHGVIDLTEFGSTVLYPKGSGGQRDDDAFLRYCGDSFVSSIERGADLYALYQFNSVKTRTTNENTRGGNFSGEYMKFSGSAGYSSHELTELMATHELAGIHYLHSAHRGVKLPHDEASLYETLADIGRAQDASDAQPYRVTITRYDTLPGWRGPALGSGSTIRELLAAQRFRLMDLLRTTRAIELTPARFSLHHAQVLINADMLHGLLTRRLDELDVVLRGCQKVRERHFSANVAENRDCVYRPKDEILSDYPYRALMPVEDLLVPKEYMGPKKEELERQVAEYQGQFIRYEVPLHFHKNSDVGGDFSRRCADNMHNENCASIWRKLNDSRAALAAYVPASRFPIEAELRYKHWIADVAELRSEGQMLGRTLSLPELMMYRRDIYCQYGNGSPDASPCPGTSILDVVKAGYPVLSSVKDHVHIVGAPLASAVEARASLQDAILKKAAELAKESPHFYELVGETFSKQDMPDKTIVFTVDGTMTVNYLSATKDFPALLSQ